MKITGVGHRRTAAEQASGRCHCCVYSSCRVQLISCYVLLLLLPARSSTLYTCCPRINLFTKRVCIMTAPLYSVDCEMYSITNNFLSCRLLGMQSAGNNWSLVPRFEFRVEYVKRATLFDELTIRTQISRFRVIRTQNVCAWISTRPGVVLPHDTSGFTPVPQYITASSSLPPSLPP